jgi:DNA-binding transcriptional LysR family regulator
MATRDRARPLDWTSLRDFLAVAESGSLSQAARLIGVSQPTLTRRMAALEERLQADLFRRSSRGLELTELGEAMLPPARQMRQEAQALEVAVTGRDQALAGPVHITATEGVAIDWLTPELATFQRAHPNIEIHFLVQNARVDLLRREADIAVRLGRPRQADLMARRVGELALGLFASTAYLDEVGRPERDEDLRQHRAVAFDEEMASVGPAHWMVTSMGDARIVYRANSLQAQLAAIRAGYGIGAQACFVAGRIAGLERVLPERERRVDLWLVTHPGLRRSTRIRSVFDFLVERFEASATLFSGGAPAEGKGRAG